MKHTLSHLYPPDPNDITLVHSSEIYVVPIGNTRTSMKRERRSTSFTDTSVYDASALEARILRVKKPPSGDEDDRRTSDPAHGQQF